MAIAFRPVGPGDEALILAAFASTREAELAALPWGEAQRQAFLQMQCAAQLQHYRSHFPAAQHLVILRDGEPAGRLYIDRQPDRIHILDIVLLPEHRGAGVGGAILRDLQAEAALHGQAVSIYVESFNPSLHLFERLGFARVSEDGLHLLLRWSPAAPPSA